MGSSSTISHFSVRESDRDQLQHEAHFSVSCGSAIWKTKRPCPFSHIGLGSIPFRGLLRDCYSRRKRKKATLSHKKLQQRDWLLRWSTVSLWQLYGCRLSVHSDRRRNVCFTFIALHSSFHRHGSTRIQTRCGYLETIPLKPNSALPRLNLLFSRSCYIRITNRKVME